MLNHVTGSTQYALHFLELKNIDKSQSYPILADFGIQNFHPWSSPIFRKLGFVHGVDTSNTNNLNFKREWRGGAGYSVIYFVISYKLDYFTVFIHQSQKMIHPSYAPCCSA